MEIEHTPLSVHINNGIIGKKPYSKLRLVYSVQSKLRSRQSKLRSRQSKLRSRQSKLRSRQSKLRSRQSNLRSRQSKLRSRQSKLRSRQSKLRSRQSKHTCTVCKTRGYYPHHIEYHSPWAGFELITLAVTGTDCIGSL
jgi:DNA repair exonuclease SbcCD ATPase subunit